MSSADIESSNMGCKYSCCRIIQLFIVKVVCDFKPFNTNKQKNVSNMYRSIKTSDQWFQFEKWLAGFHKSYTWQAVKWGSLKEYLWLCKISKIGFSLSHPVGYGFVCPGSNLRLMKTRKFVGDFLPLTTTQSNKGLENKTPNPLNRYRAIYFLLRVCVFDRSFIWTKSCHGEGIDLNLFS